MGRLEEARFRLMAERILDEEWENNTVCQERISRTLSGINSIRVRQLNPAEELLAEGFAMDTVVDALQALVGGAVEYGITIPTVGTGTPVAMGAETAVDALFAAESVASAVGAVAGMGSALGEVGDLVKEAMKLGGVLQNGDLDAFYQNVNELVAKFLKAMREKSGDAAEDIIETMKTVLEKFLDAMTDPIVKAVKIVIPDAAIGLGVGTAIRAALAALASSPFSAAETALDISKDLQDFILKPGVAIEFLKEMTASLVKLLEQAAKKIEDTGWLETFATAVAMPIGSSAIVALKALGPTGLPKLSDLIKENLPTLVDLVETIVDTLVPAVLSAMAIFQSLVSGDYKADEKSAEGEKTEDQKQVEESARRNRQLRECAMHLDGLARRERLRKLQADYRRRT